VRFYGRVEEQCKHLPATTGDAGNPPYSLSKDFPTALGVSSGVHGDRGALLSHYLKGENERQAKEGMPMFPAGEWRSEGRNPFTMQEDWSILVAAAEGMQQQLAQTVAEERWGLSVGVPPAPLVYVELRGMMISPLLRARMARSGASHCVRDRVKKIRQHLRKNSLDLDTCNPERAMAILYGRAWISYSEGLHGIGHLPREWGAPHDGIAL